MNLKRKFKVIPVLIVFFTLSGVLCGSTPFRSYGNEHLELTGGPGGSVFGQLWGLYHSGSDNVRYNPLRLESDEQHSLFLFHSLLYDQLLTASSGAYVFSFFRDKPTGVMISRVGVDQIPDTRNALLDWGSDGIPGTGDEGEGNGQLDPGERLDYERVSYHSSGITTLSLGTSLRNLFGFETGVTINGIYMNLIAENGLGLTFDLHAMKKGRYVHHLYVLSQLPAGVTAFTDGSVQAYTPWVEGSWTVPVQAGSFRFQPGLTLRYIPGYKRHEGLNIGSLGNVNVRPALYVDYHNRFRVGTAYDDKNLLSIFAGLTLRPLRLEYAYRMHSHAALGNSHLVAISFDPGFLLEESSE